MLRRYNRLLVASYVVSDAVLGVVAFGLAYLVRFSSGLIPVIKGYPPLEQYVAVLPFIARDLALTPRSFAVLLFLGAFQIALAYVLFTRGLAHVPAAQASLTGMLEPVANPVWVFLFLDERPSAFAVAGGIIVLVAIAWRTLLSDAIAEMPALD